MDGCSSGLLAAKAIRTCFRMGLKILIYEIFHSKKINVLVYPLKWMIVQSKSKVEEVTKDRDYELILPMVELYQ